MNYYNDKEKRNNLFDFLINLPQFYYIEDYTNITMYPNFYINYNKELEPNKNCIGINVLIEGKEKQIIKEINYAKRIFSFVKIYYNQYNINLLLNRNSKLNGNEILHKINQQKYLKNPIKIHLKINEFPLTNYCLEEQNFNYENNINNTYILKYVSVTDNMINNNLNSKYCLQKPNNNSLNNLQNIVNNNFNNNNNSNFNSQMNNMNNNMCSNNNM